MKSSEEIMLLLELNGYDVTKYKLKKQLEYEDSGNLDLYRHKKFSDLLISHYGFSQSTDFLYQNPLTYKDTWPDEIKSIDQFYVTHPDINGEVTFKDFINDDSYNEVNKESILYDILDTYVEEYREASITRMENLKNMIILLPKKSKKYKKPSKGSFLFSIILFLILALLFKNPSLLLLGYAEQINGFLYDIPWYSALGVLTIYILGIYAIINNFVGRYIRDVRSEKNKHAEKTFDKWEQDMKDARLKQSGMLEDYVDLVIKKPKKSYFELTTLIYPEKLMDKFKNYVKMINRKYDWMTKYYSKVMKIMRIVLIVGVVLSVIFIMLGLSFIWGWLNVSV